MTVGILRSLKLLGNFAEEQAYEKVRSDLITLNTVYENRKGQLGSFVRSISADNAVRITASLGRGSLLGEQLARHLSNSLKGGMVDILTVVDHQGRVLARGTNPESRDDDLSGNELVVRGLAGEEVVAILLVCAEEVEKEGLTERTLHGSEGRGAEVMIQAVCPILDEGEVVGVSLAGFLVAKNRLLAEQLSAQAHIKFAILAEDRITLTNITDRENNTILGENVEISIDENRSDQMGQYCSGWTSIRGEEYICFFSPLRDAGGGDVGRLVAVKDVHAIAAIKEKTATEMVLIFAAGLGLAIALGVFLLGYAMTTSLRKLARRAEQIADGDLSTPLEIKSSDEIGVLADSFDRMTKQLKKSRDEIEEYSRTLEQKVGDRTKELKQSEEQLKASLKEKEVLLKEVHHRVKNNLQVISSLLYLHSKDTTDDNIIQMFRESQNRVKSIAFIHETLYQSEDLARIDFAEYVRKLTRSLYHSYVVNADTITLELAIDEVSLGIDTAIPLGLIINELVSNSIEHAFPNSRRGGIHIKLYSGGENEVVLFVGDDGIGLPEDFDFRNTESLGLRLVNSLVDQLGGTIDLDRNNGTEFTIVH